MSTPSSPNDLLSKEELLLRLEEAEETLRAIRSGEVDALVVSGAQGDQVFTLKDATLPYQILIEEMNEGALTLSPQGIILYCNARFAEMLGLPLQTILGQSFLDLVIPDDLASAKELLEHRPDGKSKGELTLLGSQLEVPVGISLKEIKLDSEMRLGVVITDFTERKRAEVELERYREHLEDLVKDRTAQLESTNVLLLKEIGERQRVEEQLELERGNLQMMFNAVNVGMLLMGEDGSTRQVNNVVTHWIGKNPSEVNGLQPGDVLGCINVANDPGNCGHTPHCSTCPIRNTFQAVLNSGQPIHEVEIEANLLLNGNQTPLWLELSVDPLLIDGKQHAVLALNNITARKQVEGALRQSEAHLRRFYDSGLLGVIYWNMNGEITDANDRFLEMTGYSREDLAQGRIDWAHMTPPEFQHLDEISTVELKANGVNRVPFEKEYIRKDGSRLPIMLAGAMLDEARSNGVAFVLDITERKRAEEQLARSNQKISEILASIQDDFYVLDRDWNFIFVNRQFTSKIGKEPGDFLGRNIWQMFPKHLGTVFEENLRAAMEKKEIRRFELHGKYTDAWYAMTVFPSVEGVTVLGTDITVRKQAEKALLEASVREQASQYARTLIEVSLDPLVTISSEGKITDVNDATIRATGISREELIDTDFSSYFTEPERAEQGYRQVFANGFVMDYPLTLRHRDGHFMDVLYNASLYKDAHDNVLGVFAAARDVTAQKQAELELKRHKDNLEILVQERTAELKESNRELARSNENLEQFAYAASHDLQEPLRIMASYSQLLEKRYKDRLDQDANEFIDFIVEAAARMQKLITDLLAYSRAGRDVTDTTEVDCNKVLRRLLNNMAVTIDAVHGSVTFDKLPSIMTHEASLMQLFQNLIGNALKFRGDQPPVIHVSASQADGEWVFSVRDNGIGIEPQYSQRIFIIFQRLHSRDKYPGTGIGLSICKKIVDNMGGRIWVESELGQGSTFYFTVPVRKA